MSGRKAVPMLIHPGSGVPLPWWDCRIVPQQTLMDYLACDRGQWPGLVSAGILSGPGGTVQGGEIRPQTSYVPAVIWAYNGWVPSDSALALLAAGDAPLRAQIAATERLLAELQTLASGGRIRSAAAKAIPFPTSSRVISK